jgi:hypothetical protein
MWVEIAEASRRSRVPAAAILQAAVLGRIEARVLGSQSFVELASVWAYFCVRHRQVDIVPEAHVRRPFRQSPHTAPREATMRHFDAVMNLLAGG